MAGGFTLAAGMLPFLGSCDTTLTPREPGGNGGGGEGLQIDVSALTADNTGMFAEVNGPDGFPILVVRLGQGNFAALSSQCTHQGCQVDLPADNVIPCPCHGSTFGLDGSVILGPATQPLADYQTSYDSSSNVLTVVTS